MPISWTGGPDGRAGGEDPVSILVYRSAEGAFAQYAFHDTLRDDAADTVGKLSQAGFTVELLSGDRSSAVAAAAAASGITRVRAEVNPAGKLAHLSKLKAEGHTVLMIGDGLNDAPALAAGHASMSPASGSDIAQTAADAVLQGQHLFPVIEMLEVSSAAQRMARQNFAIAIAYNIVFVPLAMTGYVTPLLAAVAMSASSIAVTANAIRLKSKKLNLRPVR